MKELFWWGLVSGTIVIAARVEVVSPSLGLASFKVGTLTNQAEPWPALTPWTHRTSFLRLHDSSSLQSRYGALPPYCLHRGLPPREVGQLLAVDARRCTFGRIANM